MPKRREPRPIVRCLDVPCVLCERPRGRSPPTDWWEVKAWGPDRRAHAGCFLEIMEELREMPEGEFMRMIEEREAERC